MKKLLLWIINDFNSQPHISLEGLTPNEKYENISQPNHLESFESDCFSKRKRAQLQKQMCESHYTPKFFYEREGSARFFNLELCSNIETPDYESRGSAAAEAINKHLDEGLG